MDNAKYNCHELLTCCQNKLKLMSFNSTGKEFVGKYYVDEKILSWLTVPKGRKPLKPGTYANMAKQLKLQINEFDKLLNCTMSGEEYNQLILQKFR